MNEKDTHFLRRQAELCIALSRSTFDLTLASRLRGMAAEFHKKASEWESETVGFSPHVAGGIGSHASKPNRN
jgi:hypothetical protein